VAEIVLDSVELWSSDADGSTASKVLKWVPASERRDVKDSTTVTPIHRLWMWRQNQLRRDIGTNR
jgi:hypothetical protein